MPKKFGIKTASSIPELRENYSGKFDIILSRHVLEHVKNPLKTLTDLRTLPKKEGKLILVLPVEKDKEPRANEIDFHLYCWIPRTAINLLKIAKYGKAKWRYNYFTGKRILLPFYKKLGSKYYRLLMKLLGRTLNAKELIIECKLSK